MNRGRAVVRVRAATASLTGALRVPKVRRAIRLTSRVRDATINVSLPVGVRAAAVVAVRRAGVGCIPVLPAVAAARVVVSVSGR